MNRFDKGKLNIYVGAAGLLAASLGGLALGATFDQYATQNGFHQLSLVRFYLREGHSHGMPISLYNLIIGLLVDIWLSNPLHQKICSWCAAIGIVLPLGLVAKGAAGADPNFIPFGIIGAFGLLVSFAIILFGTKNQNLTT